MAANSLISASIEHPPIELLSLLILDDERAVREGCRDAAVSLGYQTFIAENADAAYKLLETHGIDVVMLDDCAQTELDQVPPRPADDVAQEEEPDQVMAIRIV